jgi:hypothetical protein
MILNSQIWKQAVAAAILVVAGRADAAAWTRTIQTVVREVEKAAYWSFDAQTGVLRIKSTTSDTVYIVTAEDHTCHATLKFGKRCKHQAALRLLIRYTALLGASEARAETKRPSMLAAGAIDPLQPPTLRGEMCNGVDV